MSRSSFPIRTAETLDQGGGLPSTVCPCLTATVKYHYSCLPQSVRSNIAGNDVDYPPFLMPPLSMFRVIYEIEARHKDEILLILLILEFPSMFDPCEQRLLFQQCNNYETCYSSSNRYIYFQRNFRKISSRRKERKKRYNAEAHITIYYLSNVSTTRQISRVSRAIVGRRSPSHNGRGEDDIMIIILDVGNRPIRVMDGDFKTEGDPVIPGRPLCRQPNFPARLIPPVNKDAVEGKRKERKRKKTR